jgi:dihydroorotate dehydrogenase
LIFIIISYEYFIVYKLIRPLLFLLPAETAHRFTLKALSFASSLGLLSMGSHLQSSQTTTVMGIEFPNRVGLAAGLDKNGEYIKPLSQLGFGFIEVGTITPRPQPGNPLPRLFRVVEAEGVINRMGFNNEGVDYLLKQVSKVKFSGVLGINIGKNFDTLVEHAADDYVICLRKVYKHADYITINISSPNTPGLRSLQYGEELSQLLERLKHEQTLLTEKYNKYTPLVVKVAPDLTEDEIEDIASVLLKQGIDGLIATNTTLSREAVEGYEKASEQGGLSGKPLTEMSTKVIASFYRHLRGQIPIIGVGGISSGMDAQEKLKAGAELVQIYSGLVYQGANLIKQAISATEVDYQ